MSQNTTMDFKFKYVPEDELNKIVQEVRRERRKRMEEKQWEMYVASKSKDELCSKCTVAGKVSSTELDMRPEDLCECYVMDCECVHSHDNANVVIDEAGDTNVALNCNAVNAEEQQSISSQFPGGDYESLMEYLPEEVMSRLEKIELRLSTSLNKVMQQVEKQISVLDEEDDIKERRAKRATEFTARFSRNYLYQLRRQLEMLKKEKFINAEDFFKKLTLVFQTAAQGLQTCQHFLPDNSRNACNKITEFLKELVVLLNYGMEQMGKTEHREDMVLMAKHISTKIQTNIKEEEKALADQAIKNENSRLSPNMIRPKKQIPPNKLSMYCSKLPKDLWKKTSAKLAKNKFGVAPRKKYTSGENALLNKSHKNLQKKPGPSNVETGKLKIIEKFRKDWVDEQEHLKTIRRVSEDVTKIVKSEPIPEQKIETEVARVPLGEDIAAEDPSHRPNSINISNGSLCKILNQISDMYKNSSLLGFNSSALEKRTNCICMDKLKDGISETVKQEQSENVKLVCIKFDEKENSKQKEKFQSIKGRRKKECIVSEDGKKLCIPFSVNGAELESCKKYKDKFQKYMSRDLRYRDTEQFLKIVNRISDYVLSRIINCVTDEIEDTAITRRLYELELCEN